MCILGFAAFFVVSAFVPERIKEEEVETERENNKPKELCEQVWTGLQLTGSILVFIHGVTTGGFFFLDSISFFKSGLQETGL